MSLFSLFAIFVYASETVLSPLADRLPATAATETAKPTVTFGQLRVPMPQLPFQAAREEPTPTPTATRQSKKSHYTIALLGDSMVDTLGPGIPRLAKQLTALYPATTFSLLNYGVGGTNIDYGLTRVTHDYDYLGKHIPSLVTQHPDVVVVESFGYNPYTFEKGAVDRHWLQLAAIVDSLRSNLPGVKIVIAATIAPNSRVFGDGAPNIAFSIADKLARTNVIKQYLESTVKFAASQHLPLADAYHPSLDVFGNGKLTYINGGDHIHYSEEGRQFFTQKVSETIVNNHILE